MKRHHRWGEPDENEARACTHEGCTVRVRDAFREWQPAKGRLWRSWLKQHIPECEGRVEP